MTTTNMTPEERESLAAGFALDALDAEETRVAQALLNSDPAFAAEVASFDSVTDGLAALVAPAVPSAALRGSILDAIQALPQQGAQGTEATVGSAAPSAAPSATPTVASPASAAAVPSADTAVSGTASSVSADSVAPVVPPTRSVESTPVTRARGSRLRGIRLLTGVLAAVLLVVAGVGLGRSVFAPTVTPEASDHTLTSLLASADLQRSSTPVTGGGTATVVWSPDHARAAIATSDLPELGKDRVLELWLIDGSGARAAGTFTPGDSGVTWTLLDGTLKPGDSVGMTVEPKGGSKAPTTDPILVVGTSTS
ncbi:anti-sigma-K factor RskA [Mycetocola sp. BIGb0189]|uniref:anti-sigma factor domain-containing protein n=1 Tax=Mycetocola sp. BIGb0189 TaxID=2940604 RepID=UPI0021684B39|nr:anti-sigma factor [Mycetocola sp. BIGb0189]MCS4275451.1 anti-sigma-K factor RskA [Mycetocola sp. BIGb0189]